jgi:rhodanese-related sulfurtransferase
VIAREAKDGLYAQFGRMAKATSSPRRIELLELLAQTERGVEELARMTGMEVGNTSAQLQVLSRARLVEGRRVGKRVLYRLTDQSVSSFLAALRSLSRARLPEVEAVERAYFGARDELEPVGCAELLERAERGEVIVIDVRPREEYEAGHIPGARCLPLSELEARLHELPPDAEIVAYCRGPYCVLAPQAVEVLRRAAFKARRLADGLPEWRLAGMPVD